MAREYKVRSAPKMRPPHPGSILKLDILPALQTRWNDRAADPLFSTYPIARPVTVDVIRGGEWQGMIADRCVIGGYLELLPADEPAAWRERFINELCKRTIGVK